MLELGRSRLEEAGPLRHDEGDVEPVEPDDGLVPARVHVAVPAAGRCEDEVARAHRHGLPVDDHAGAAAGRSEAQGREGVGVDRRRLSGEQHLVGGDERVGGAEAGPDEAGVAEQQGPALQRRRPFVEHLDRAVQLGHDLVPVPDVRPLRDGGLVELAQVPERHRRQRGDALVVAANVSARRRGAGGRRGEGVGHRCLLSSRPTMRLDVEGSMARRSRRSEGPVTTWPTTVTRRGAWPPQPARRGW